MGLAIGLREVFHGAPLLLELIQMCFPQVPFEATSLRYSDISAIGGAKRCRDVSTAATGTGDGTDGTGSAGQRSPNSA